MGATRHSVGDEMNEEIHLSFGIAQKSLNEYLALNRDRNWRCQMTNEQ